MNTSFEIQGKKFPVLPMRNTVVYPGQTVPLLVGRKRTVAAVEHALKSEPSYLITVAQRADGEGDPSVQNLYRVGTLSKVDKARGDADQGYQLLVSGLRRVHIDEFSTDGEYLQASAQFVDDLIDVDKNTQEALVRGMKDLAVEILKLLPTNTAQVVETIQAIEDPILLSHLVAQYLDMDLAHKQEVLEELSLKSRYLKLLDRMATQRDQLQIQRDIGQRISRKMGKQQKEALLREQIRALQEELGEGAEVEQSEYATKIAEAGMPEEALKVAQEQLKRLEALSEQSPEANIIRNYLDLLIAMPWSKSAEPDFDLERARNILEEDHYGLEKIKKRIVQHLAVMKLKKDKKGSVLLLVGPPGVGKTSLGKSIARALGRKFVRASLGGVRDDAEIRGHRRTYVGALPGRIIDGIKRAGENNPVFMLDEIDKLSRGFSGDPASALLEVLDPEQNNSFHDHYLDVPWDLSQVFFVATANSLEGIPGPLLDRMEVIRVAGYTTPEKLHIAKRHLVPELLEEHGLKASDLVITEAALLQLITGYTRESGVRELKRKIAEVTRWATEKVLEKEAKLPVRVDVESLDEILGPEKFVHEVAQIHNPPGVATGLAWTPMGGEILFIEATRMPGSGKLTLTGQLGDVMKESAQIALSLARSKVGAWARGFDHYKTDIHIHVPAGAIPKDGPSAGVTMLTVIASVLTNRKVDPKLAMTGEITLRGAVMPVGGIKEKLIAAHRAGIERVLLSKRNEKDLREVPEEVLRDLKIHFAETADDVLKLALDIDPPARCQRASETGKQSPAVA